MNIKVYSTHEKLEYRYQKTGIFKLRLANNVSAASFSGEQLNNIKNQLTEVNNFDENFVELSSCAFADCIRLKSVNIGETILSIGEKCFMNCVSLQEIKLPRSVKRIGEYAFSSCRNMAGLKYGWYDDDKLCSECSLSYAGDCMLSDAVRTDMLILPKSMSSAEKFGSKCLSGSSISQFAVLGMNAQTVNELTSTQCFGIGHNCDIYTADNRKIQYRAQSNSMIEDAEWSAYAEMKIDTGKVDRMSLGRKIYKFEKDLLEWCINPEKQGKKFPKRECPAIIIFCDLKTSDKSRIFAENVLKQPGFYTWIKENLKCYVFLMDRNGSGRNDAGTTDLAYYRNIAEGKNHNTGFVTVDFIYGDKFESVQLSDLSLAGFKKTLIEYCEKAGFNKFDPTGYNRLDEPEPETAPNGSVDQQSIAEFHAGGFDWYQNGAMKNPEQWDLASKSMDFRLVSTPETTYVLVCTYDVKYETDPAEIKTKLYPILETYSDNAHFHERCCSKNKQFIPGITEGLNYRFLIFFEFSHGNKGGFTVDGGVTKTELWNTLSPAKNRIFGMFDSCHSGSMFKTGSEQTADDQPLDMAEYLIGKFDRRKTLMTKLFNASTDQIDPYIMLWSSTTADTYGWYIPPSCTIFQRAINRAYEKQQYGRFNEIFEMVVKNGTRYDKEHKAYSTPQMKTYNIDFSKNKIFT